MFNIILQYSSHTYAGYVYMDSLWPIQTSKYTLLQSFGPTTSGYKIRQYPPWPREDAMRFTTVNVREGALNSLWAATNPAVYPGFYITLWGELLSIPAPLLRYYVMPGSCVG